MQQKSGNRHEKCNTNTTEYHKSNGYEYIYRSTAKDVYLSYKKNFLKIVKYNMVDNYIVGKREALYKKIDLGSEYDELIRSNDWKQLSKDKGSLFDSKGYSDKEELRNFLIYVYKMKEKEVRYYKVEELDKKTRKYNTVGVYKKGS